MQPSSLLLSIALVGIACVMGRPSVPPPVGANAMVLQQMVSTAVASGPPVLTIPAGKYVFSNTSLTIEGAQDLLIEAYGVTLVFYLGFGVQIMHTRNLTVRGMTLDSDPPNYAQGNVTRWLNSSAFVAKIDERFIPPDTTAQPFNQPGGTAGAKIMIWDAATRLPSYAYNFMRSSVPSGSGLWTIGMKHPGLAMAAGSLVTIFPRRGYTWRNFNSSATVAEDITIHAGGNMGFLEQVGEGGHVYRRVRIVRGPGSPGLMALNADGFHSTSVRVGPALEDSEIAFTGDDHLNLLARMLVVCTSLGATAAASSSAPASAPATVSSISLAIIDVANGALATQATEGASRFDDAARWRAEAGAELGFDALAATRPGDEMRFYQLLPGNHPPLNPLIGAATIASSVQITDGGLLKECHAAAAAMQQPPYNAHLIVNVQHSPVYRIDFMEPLPAAVTATKFNLVSLERQSGADAVLRGNNFHDSCGSGGRIILKTRNATYVDNIAARFGGLHVYTEQEWLEGDLGLRNVHLKNNTFIDTHGTPSPIHVDVMQGLENVTCQDTTYVIGKNTTTRSRGC